MTGFAHKCGKRDSTQQFKKLKKKKEKVGNLMEI